MQVRRRPIRDGLAAEEGFPLLILRARNGKTKFTVLIGNFRNICGRPIIAPTLMLPSIPASLRHLQLSAPTLHYLAVARNPFTNWNFLTVAAVHCYSLVSFPYFILRRAQLQLGMMILALARFTLLHWSHTRCQSTTPESHWSSRSSWGVGRSLGSSFIILSRKLTVSLLMLVASVFLYLLLPPL